MIARSASSVASTVGAVAAGERGLGLDERGGLRALVIGFCGSLASCPRPRGLLVRPRTIHSLMRALIILAEGST